MTKVLITGGTGCIGAITTARLLAMGADEVVAVSRSSDAGILGLWLGEELDPRVRLVSVDLDQSIAVEAVVMYELPDVVIHLGALQTPACNADPAHGMRVNVGGTLALFEAAKKHAGLRRFVFASSAAVYGKREMYPGATVRENEPLDPPNLYGVWKLAGEGLARLYHEASGVPTVSLRLNTTYGLGRDAGKTSAPTTALKAIALAHSKGAATSFEMPYQGRENYHFVEDVGEHFARAALDDFAGYGAFNLRGTTVEVGDFLETAQHVAAELDLVAPGAAATLSIAANAEPNLFVCDLDESAIVGAFPKMPKAELAEGIRKSLLAFARLARAGRLSLPA